MNFSQALESLKLGSKIQREGWNGKGMYLTLVQGYPVNGHLNAVSCSDDEKELPNLSVPELNPDGTKNITQGKAGQMLSHIVMKTAGDSQFWGAGYSDYVPWLASQTDILAEDWNILVMKSVCTHKDYGKCSRFLKNKCADCDENPDNQNVL